MKRKIHYMLFVTLQTKWTEGPYRWRNVALDNGKKIVEMTPHPPTHAKVRVEECDGRKRITTIAAWAVENGEWVLTVYAKGGDETQAT